MAIVSRSGALSRLAFFIEATRGSDAGIIEGYILPLGAQSTVKSAQNLIEAPLFNGLRLPFGAIAGNIDVSGKVPLQMEFYAIGAVLKTLVGASGYSRPGGGTDTLHRYIVPTTLGANPGSAQVQQESLEGTAQYLRWRSVLVGGLGFSYSTEGVAKYDLTLMGTGDELQTAHSVTATDHGYEAASYFNGYAKYGSKILAGMTEFRLDFEANLSRLNAAFTGGVAAAIAAGNLQATGHLALMFGTDGTNPENNMAFYNDAVNQSIVAYDCCWSDLPPAIATQWLRIVLTSLKLGRSSWMAGGPNALTTSQGFRAVTSATKSKTAAESWGRITGPYTITVATNDAFAVKVDGGGTITVTLTAGVGITTDAIVAQLNADAGFNVKAVADNFNGRVRVTSLTVGAAGSVQFDTTALHHCGTTLGMLNVAFSGLNNCPILIELYNTRQTDY